MASLLYRLGLLAARRAKTVIMGWLALLGIAVASFLSFGGQLTDQITLPDLETTQVADRLAEELPDASGGSATAVLRADDGSEFSESQREEVAQLIDDVEALEPVDSVTDPFETEAELADAQTELSEGRTELEEGAGELEEGREEIEGAYEELDEGQEQLDLAIAEAQEQGYYEMMAGEFELQQQQIDEGRGELDEALGEIEDGEQELASGEAELERGESLMELSEGLHMVSEEGDVALLAVNFHQPLESVGMEELAEVSDTLTEATISGVEVLPSAELSMEMPHLFSVAEAIGLMVAAAVLLVMLGTLIGAGLPLLNALVGVGIGVAGAMSLSGAVEMMSMTPILGLMLGLAVGIDYALFILHRHRNQLKDGMDVRESIALANGTAGNAVVFAGATVVIALLALNVTGLPFLGLMGTVAAVCVLIAVLMATTMTPALLSLVGRRILRRKERRHIGMRSAKKITSPLKTPKALGIAVLSLAALAVLAIPTFSMRLGLPDASSQAEDSDAYQAYQTTDEAFGQGMNGPLIAVADFPSGLSEDEAADYQIEVGTELAEHADIDAAVPMALNDDNSVAVFQVLPEEGPASESVEQLVHEFRDSNILAGSEVSDVDLSVAGITAANIDMSSVIADALPLYLGLVVGLSLLLMVMVFRSVLLPVVATLGFIASFAAAMGIVVAVFQWGWFSDLFGITEPGPIVTFLPIIMVGILFGLAMDYQLFTASGMREAYAHGSAPRLAVRQGLYAGRSVVTAAALIMASVFGGFVFTPDPMIASIGLGLATGVLLDAFVVRLLLVPAVLHLLGPAAWWLPKWLDKILPDVDVEGSALERSHGAAEDESGSNGVARNGTAGSTGSSSANGHSVEHDVDQGQELSAAGVSGGDQAQQKRVRKR